MARALLTIPVWRNSTWTKRGNPQREIETLGHAGQVNDKHLQFDQGWDSGFTTTHCKSSLLARVENSRNPWVCRALLAQQLWPEKWTSEIQLALSGTTWWCVREGQVRALISTAHMVWYVKTRRLEILSSSGSRGIQCPTTWLHVLQV